MHKDVHVGFIIRSPMSPQKSKSGLRINNLLCEVVLCPVKRMAIKCLKVQLQWQVTESGEKYWGWLFYKIQCDICNKTMINT